MKPAKTLIASTLSICLVSLLGCTEPETQTAPPLPAQEKEKTQEASLLKTKLSERIRIEGLPVFRATTGALQSAWCVGSVYAKWATGLDHGKRR